MPRFAANLSTMFTERPWFERFGAAREAGFRAIEYLFPYEHSASDLRAARDGVGLEQALFNAPPGDWEGGERGLASLPDRREAFARSLETLAEYASAIEPTCVHIMAGLGGDRATFIDNLRQAVEAVPEKVTPLIEPINARNMPGYHLRTTGDAVSVIEAVGSDRLRLQLDLYHCQISEGDVAHHIRDLLPMVGHIQIAGVPERQEPDIGEMNYPYLFDLLDDLGYEGFVGCEYHPRGVTEEGLGWFEPYREGQ